MSDFRQLTESFWVSPQITEADVAQAHRLGCRMVINNRPEGESDDQTEGAAIARACNEAGLDYEAIPITHAGFSESQVDQLIATLERADGPTLAYCRSGTRSTLLWALAQAKRGTEPGMIVTQAEAAGYDVTPIQPLIDMLHSRSTG